jgi:phage baseplate assembly protein V
MVGYDLEQRVISLEKQLNQTVRVGQVTSIDTAAGTARVILPDSDGVASYDLPVLFQKTQNDKYYTMPDIGEQVLCIFLPNGQEQGFILGSFFSGPDSVPVTSPDKTHIRFKDGTWLEYDRRAHLLKGHVVNGEIHLIADQIHFNSIG